MNPQGSVYWSIISPEAIFIFEILCDFEENKENIEYSKIQICKVKNDDTRAVWFGKIKKVSMNESLI